MFTGIVEAVGHIAALQRGGGDVRVHIHTGKLNMSGARLKNSIAVKKNKHTTKAIADHGFSADCSAETLRCTAGGAARAGGAGGRGGARAPGAPRGGRRV